MREQGFPRAALDLAKRTGERLVPADFLVEDEIFLAQESLLAHHATLEHVVKVYVVNVLLQLVRVRVKALAKSALVLKIVKQWLRTEFHDPPETYFTSVETIPSSALFC